MRNGDALTKPGGAELFAREQTVENQTASDIVMVFEQQPDAFKHALFAARIKIQQDVVERQ